MGLETLSVVVGHAGGAALLNLLSAGHGKLKTPIIYASPVSQPLTGPGWHIHADELALAGPAMLVRLLEYAARLLEFSWEVALLVQYDQWVVAAPPQYPGGFACDVLHRDLFTDHRPPTPYLAERFCGVPWMFDRNTAALVLKTGTALLRDQKFENSIDDRFLGLICQEAGIPLRQLPGLCCRWNQDLAVPGAIPLDPTAWIYHPVKTAEHLARIESARRAL